VQGHCHHKAIFGVEAERQVLDAMGLESEVLSAGCCGMAGAFGFVEETRAVGVASGERALLPRVRSEPKRTIVMANGFSCREQIEQRTSRRALHLAEVLKLALDHGPSGPPGAVPEAAIVARRRRGVRASILRAGLGLAAVAALVVGARMIAGAGRRRRFVW
jgi:hypothetical protein